MDSLSIATAGVTAASNRFAASAERVAAGGDVTAELTEQASDKVAFEASVAVARTSEAMSKQLLDMLA